MRQKIIISSISLLVILLLIFIRVKYEPQLPQLPDQKYLEIFKDSVRRAFTPAIMLGDGKNKFLLVHYEKDNRWIYDFVVTRQQINSYFSFDSIENIKFNDNQSGDMHLIPEYYMFMYGDDSSTVHHVSFGFDNPPKILRISDNVQMYSFSLQSLNISINNKSIPIYKLKFAPSQNDLVKFDHMPMDIALIRKENYLYFIFKVSPSGSKVDSTWIYNMINL